MTDIVKRLRDEYLAMTRNEAADEIERLREALEAVVACHGSNPSDAIADMPEVDYIKYTLWTARTLARTALDESK